MLFTIVQVQLMSGKANQSALVMAKLIDYFKYVKVPKDDSQHFYTQFGSVIKHLLSNKEFNVFFITLNAFMNWAEITDISDLNFMVPDDSTVQQLLQNFMSNRRIDME